MLADSDDDFRPVGGQHATDTVSFDANGGTGTMTAQSGPDGTDVTLPDGSRFSYPAGPSPAGTPALTAMAPPTTPGPATP